MCFEEYWWISTMFALVAGAIFVLVLWIMYLSDRIKSIEADFYEDENDEKAKS